MNKTAIWAIIILMSAAMIGIAAIQIYWINFSIRLDEKKFDERVFSALNRVEERISKAEEETDRSLINGSPSMQLNNPLKMFKEGLGSSILGSDSLLSTDVLPYSGYEPWKRKILFYELRSMQHRIVNTSLEKRIKPKVVGLMLRQELSNRGIDLYYNYGVIDHEKDDFVIINDNYSVPLGDNDMVSHVDDVNVGLYDSPYEVDLFPSEEGSPGALKIHFPNKRGWLWESVWPLILSSVLFMGLILFCFSYTVYVIFRQKKLSEMKSDFVNNMTHEFKTPIATISLATDSITNPMIISSKDKITRFANIIRQENKRMLNQVEKVLQMALIDKEDFRLNIGPLDLHSTINTAVKNMELQVKKRGGWVKTQLDAEHHMIEGDQTHVSNIIYNLLDNANKYTPETPHIEVFTRNVANGIEVEVKDNGIGLSKEARKQIFEKFYRVHTGNLHDVKGFGLGLSYVKAMMTAHKGGIEVKSELGHGSSFILQFPLRQGG